MTTLDLRAALPGAEGSSPELEQRYRERLRALLERRITPIERASHAFGLLIGLGLAARFVQLFAQHRADGRPFGLAGLALGFAFAAGWAWVSGAILKSGTDRVLGNRAVRRWILVAFTSLQAGLMLWAGLESPDPVRGTHLILFGLAFWVLIGLPYLIVQLVQRSELRVRTDLLRTELAREQAARGGETRG